MKYPVVEIGKLCLQTEQRDPRNVPDLPFAYVDISSVDKDLKAIVQTQEIIGRDAPSRARKVIRTEDVLVSTVRPNLNAVAIILPELDGQIASTGFCVLRPKPALINSRYLFYRTLTQDFVSYLTARIRGANYPAVTDEVVRRATIPLPPLTEQRRVVEILDQTDTLRRKRAEADAKTVGIVPGLFYKTFGDPATNPKRWDFTSLCIGGALVRYGLGEPPKASPNGIPLIRATNICRGAITDDEMMFVSRADVPKSRNAFLSADEVIVVRSGAYTGDVAQVTERWADSVAGYELVITPGESFCGECIETYLLTPHIQKNYFGNLRARAGQPHLNASQLSATPILLPPKSLQLRFAEYVRQIRYLQEQIAKSRREVDNMFNTLLYRAFSGDFTTKWREAHIEELLAEMQEQDRTLAKPSLHETEFEG